MAETVASYSVPEHHVKMYTANVQSALMKQGGLLQGYVTVGSYRGEKVQVVNFLGPSSSSSATCRTRTRS